MKRESGFTLIELLIVVAIISILGSIAVMAMVRSRAAANESSAIGSLRAITSAQIAYTASCGNGGFASTLETLGVPAPGSPVPYLSTDVTYAAVVYKAGYRIEVSGAADGEASLDDCNGTATESGFYASAEPVSYGMGGNRSFATATPEVVIWQVADSEAPAEPFTAPATPLR